MYAVVGLDLSLSRTGMCYIPSGWSGDPKALRLASIETKREAPAYGKAALLAKMQVERQLEIAEKVVGFVREHKVRHVARENYAHSLVRGKRGQPMQSASVTSLAELSGVIQSQLLLACSVSVVPIPPNTARKYLTGGLKRGQQKEQVRVFLEEVGMKFRNPDEMDAFVIAYCMYGQVNEVRSRFLPQSELPFL